MGTSGELSQGIRGVCPVLSAAFSVSGALDLESFRSLCAFVASSGVNSVMIFGVATENSKLTDDERSAMLDVALDECHAKGVRVVATTADHSTELAVQRAKSYEQLGVDLINVLPSYFLKPPHDQVVHHLSSILRAVNIPVIIQSLPLGGNELPLAQIVGLRSGHPNLVQVKVENIPSTESVSQVLELSGGRVTPLVGWGGLEWREASQAGAVGVQPGCSLTEIYLEAQSFLDRDDEEGFAEVFDPLRVPLEAWMRHPEVLIAVEKEILYRRGIIQSPYCRHPSAQVSAEDMQHADNMLQRLPGSQS